MKKLFYFLVLSYIMSSCQTNAEADNTQQEKLQAIQEPVNIPFQVLNIFPHDTSSYTQGLIWYEGKLWEGTGLLTESKLLLTDLKTGKAIKSVKLPDNEFGEGITILNNKIYQLTWEDHKVYVYDLKTLKQEKVFDWPYEGWGITTDGKALLVSTGGSNLYWVDPSTFKITKTLGVSDNNGYVDSINELEWINGFIYANKYLTDYILKIDPSSGLVVGKLNLTGLLQQSNQPIVANTDVLNGIAFNPTTGNLLITGKRWPALFELKLN
ncbi:glutaminyl-peptide cyclotransferase [Sediminibacterium sp.]|uniref:glutaminyl-peptide cyclotransferase n=1 Tax=Sediminibacterium sp. TaxID=1917865 RepID=UPI002733D30B|nr:glutaminyl-peptide cyclotransferase [Sediminibacterium sp.]MDP3393824.1 glutaminyl-peptide cyclotransferase [Sediminibacterium sp.]MDP3568846.1 glutaminyl-peptide cyclotransferase [Sediminibacterium sp.]